MTLEWEGDRMRDRMRRAERYGVNKTMEQAVVFAKTFHPWRNRTGTLEGSIAIVEYAHTRGRSTVGLWGSRDVRYALALELGFRGVVVVDSHTRTITQAFGRPIAPTEVHVRAHTRTMNLPAHPYLRPAADVIYPNLAGNIREYLRR